MSDLAPFVAAVLRDKSNADFMEENASLRREIDSLRCQLHDIRAVKMTGVNGTPVFARAQLEDGQVSRDGLNQYLVDFLNPISPTTDRGEGQLQQQQQQQQPPPPQQQQQQDDGPGTATAAPSALVRSRMMEVHIGGFGRIEMINGFFHRAYYQRNNGYGIWFCPANGFSALRNLVFGGPFTSEAEFNAYDPNDNATNLLLSDTNINGELLKVYFCLAVFDADAITGSGLIDNLEQRRPQAPEVTAPAAAVAQEDAQEDAAAHLAVNVDDNHNHLNKKSRLRRAVGSFRAFLPTFR